VKLIIWANSPTKIKTIYKILIQIEGRQKTLITFSGLKSGMKNNAMVIGNTHME